MVRRIVVKWGGGLITDKSTLLTPDQDIISMLAKCTAEIVKSGYQVILVHGAGSFGHLRAKHWKLHMGKQSENFEPQGDIRTQEDAVIAVRNDMLSLNQYVMSGLKENGVTADVYPANTWATETGGDFIGDLTEFESSKADVVVTFGDVVDCKEPKKFGILSGDDLVKRLSIELEGVERLIFAIRGVDGLLTAPPGSGYEEVIEILDSNSEYLGEHDSSIDVTGGIGLKVQRGLEVAKHGTEVLMINGEIESRYYNACLGNQVIGTKIVH